MAHLSETLTSFFLDMCALVDAYKYIYISHVKQTCYIYRACSQGVLNRGGHRTFKAVIIYATRFGLQLNRAVDIPFSSWC